MSKEDGGQHDEGRDGERTPRDARLDMTAEFKDRSVCDIGISEIRALQRKRLK
jgi:hypothetical protein